MLRGIYSAIYDEVHVSVSGGYVHKKLVRPETLSPTMYIGLKHINKSHKLEATTSTNGYGKE